MCPEIFKREMEERFGSDEAFGLYFVLDEDGSIMTLAQFEALRKTMPIEALPGMESRLADGGSGTCCTDYAEFIYNALPGRVEIWGFANEDNPNCRIAQEEWHPGGHDFAIVDNRFIVDPWPRLVACTCDQMVFDLKDSDEAEAASRIYGTKGDWVRLEDAERHAASKISVAPTPSFRLKF